MEKRLPLAQSADPQVSAETVEAMTQQKYLALVQPKIQETCYTPRLITGLCCDML